jgi:hypothetical protein
MTRAADPLPAAIRIWPLTVTMMAPEVISLTLRPAWTRLASDVEQVSPASRAAALTVLLARL